MRRKKILNSIISIIMIFVMVLGMIPADTHASVSQETKSVLSEEKSVKDEYSPELDTVNEAEESVEESHALNDSESIGSGEILAGNGSDGRQESETGNGDILYGDAAESETVTFTSESGRSVEIQNGDTLNVATSEVGTFTCGSYNNDDEILEWSTSWDGGEDWHRPITINLYDGRLFIKEAGRVEAQVKNGKTGAILCTFNIISAVPEVEEIKLYIDGTDYTDSSYEVAGNQWKTIDIMAKMQGSDEFVKQPNASSYTIEADEAYIRYSEGKTAGFAFSEPGTGTLTVSFGDVSASFEATSTYVPVESISLNLPKQIRMHTLMYSGGSQDNYITLTQPDLDNGIVIEPYNSSYNNVEWSGSDDSIASYYDTHNNGFIGHSQGTLTITAVIDDNGTERSASADVEFVFDKLLEGVAVEDDQDNFTLEAETDMKLPLEFLPDGENAEDQPSQPGLDWTYSEEGIVEIKQNRGQYDVYASKTFVMTGLSEGVVEVTGTPIAAVDGVEPVRFTVTVTANSAPPPDNSKLVSQGLKSCKSFYNILWEHDTWQFNDEWDVIALKRAGIPLDKDEEAAIKSYRDSIEEQIEKGILKKDTKPTTIARVALALEAIGADASSFGGFDFYDALVNSDAIEDGSNEPIWVLIALDAKRTEISEDAKYSRDALIDAVLSFQTQDGGFSLGHSETGGDVDLTAMAIQALSNYQDVQKAKDATDRALDYLKSLMDKSCDFTGASESLSQVIIAVSSLGKDITDKEHGFTSGEQKTAFVALDKYNDSIGFKHTKEDEQADPMATQQAYMALTAWTRLINHQNSLYDMTDVVSENYEVPVITITGAEDGETVKKSGLSLEISADAGADGLKSLQVWCNGTEVPGSEGTYNMKLKSGSNSLNVKAVSQRGATAQTLWNIKFAPVDYTKDVNKKVSELTSWAESVLASEYDAAQDELLMVHTRNGKASHYALDDALKDIKSGITYKNVGEWTNAILFLTAAGVQVSDIYGINLWEAGESFLPDISMEDAVRLMTAVNARYGQQLPESISRETLLKKISPNEDGGFGGGNVSNVYDTACAVIALSREPDKTELVENAIDWISKQQTEDGKFTAVGSYSDIQCLTKVLEALSEAGINFTLDDRFNNEENLYTGIQALYGEADDSQKMLLYRALLDYQRVSVEKNTLLNMDDVVFMPGLTQTEGKIEQIAADYLKSLNYEEYSAQTTEAAYLLLRGNQATKSVYDYLDVLKKAIDESGLKTQRECFFAGLYLKENQEDLSNLFALLDGMSYDVQDKLFDDITHENGTIPMSYALMTLNLQPKGNENKRGELLGKINANRASDGKGRGFCLYPAEFMAPYSPESTILAMTALHGEESLDKREDLIAYLCGNNVGKSDEQQMEVGYWGDYRIDGNKLVGNLATTADMAAGLPYFGVDPVTDEKFQKKSGNITHGIRAFYRDGGFADTPDGQGPTAAGTIAGYRALLALKFADAENSLSGIYDAGGVREADRRFLDAKVAEAEKLNKDEYTPDTWKALEEALDRAEKAATQKEINLALEDLTNAINGLKSNREITVSFRLIGDSNHGKKGEHTGYINWIKTKSYTIENGAAVYDVFVKALEEAELESRGADSNYVSMIKAPAVFGGYELSEMTNGPLSGWKYMVNGEYPNVGLKKCKLEDGDEVIWRYIDDYTNAEDDTELWKEAADKEPAEVFEDLRSDAKKQLNSYKDLSLYREEQQKELEKILEDALKQVDEAADWPKLKEAADAAKKAMDAVKTAEQLTQEEMQGTADAVIAAIDKIKEPVTKDQKEVIEAARKAYDALSEEQKKLVTNYDKLTRAEKELDKLLNPGPVEEDKDVEKVIEAIDKIKEPVTVEQKAVIEAARKAYDALSAEQKKLVTNYDKLTKAEKELEKLLNPGLVTLINKQYGISLKSDKLTEDMELVVTALDKNSEAVAAMRKEIPSTKALFRPYEIKLKKDGKEIELPGKALLSIPVGEKYNSKELTALHHKDDGISKVNGKVTDGNLVLEITKLGSFGAVIDNPTDPSNDDKNNGNNGNNGKTPSSGSGGKGSGVKTGDQAPIIFMVILLVVSGGIAGLTIRKRKKQNR